MDSSIQQRRPKHGSVCGNFCSTLALLAAVTAPAVAQHGGKRTATADLVIAGRVVEFGVSHAIPDAEVIVERYDGAVESSLTPKAEVARGHTNIDGGFSFCVEKEGRYRISVKKDGYLTPGRMTGAISASAEVVVQKTDPVQAVHLQLSRPAEIEGFVVEEETETPATGLPVMIGRFTYSQGRTRAVVSGQGVTGADGRFVFRGLAPAEYVVAVGPGMRSATELQRNPDLRKLGATDRTLLDFSKADTEAVDRDYEWTYWPGGTTFEAALPVSITSGQSVDLGRLRIPRVTKYRVLISISGNGCVEGESVNVYARRASNPPLLTPLVGTVRCGVTALLRGFSPGLYELEAVVAGGAHGRVPSIASMQFAVGDENTAIAVPVLRGRDIEGMAVLTEGSKKIDLSGVRLLIQPTAYGAVRHAFIPIDSTGKFEIDNVPTREYRLRVSGSPPSHYLKEVRYNGRRLQGTVFAVDPLASAQSLELVFDDRPAALMGSVKNEDGPVAQSHVVLAPSSDLNNPELFNSLLTAAGDQSGRYSFSGLPPGDYKLIAVAPDARQALERPDILQRLLTRADTISVGRSQVLRVDVTMAKP